MTSPHPLAERLRPDSLEDFIGQPHLKERIKALIAGTRLPSLLFFGPPGSGKSTLALLLARSSGKKFVRFSAPEIGLTALRKKIEDLDILVLDELHRFSKAQQDFFLPLLESGQLTLLATTTENPSFSVTRQLLSRMHVMRLRGLTGPEMLKIADRAEQDNPEQIPRDSLEMLASIARGDARSFLNLLEYALTLKKEDRVLNRLQTILPEVISRGDQTGDNHFELASALIKSIRGSDPDAAVYYLACMLESGEDPRFICRRLILSASEDVGLADPAALSMAVSCQQAIELIGMPEGFIPLAETAVYLALSPKSNTCYAAYLAAKKEINNNGPQPVPLHLRNASTKLHKEWGYGHGYKYPHNFPESWIDQEYLPASLTGRKFYSPKNQGHEPRLNAWLKRRK